MPKKLTPAEIRAELETMAGVCRQGVRSRRASGTTVENMTRVMGAKTMTAGEIYEALTKGGVQIQAANPTAFLSAVLCSAKAGLGPDDKVFMIVTRGKYRVVTAKDRKAARKARRARLLAAWRWQATLSDEEQVHIEVLGKASEDDRHAVMDMLGYPE